MPLFFIILTLFCTSILEAIPCISGPHLFSAGVESYYVHRTREGGTKQNGWLTGAYLSYERFRPSAFYWAADYSVAYGPMKGKGGGGDKLKSWLLDEKVEGRFGYTFSIPTARAAWLTPFLGYGYFYQTNRFVDPSPLEIRYRDTFPYAVVGFATGLRLNPCWSAAFSFKGLWMVDGHSKITGDPDFDAFTLVMEERWQYEVELPIHYQGSSCFSFTITPFCRLLHFGGKEQYPFDFLETRFTNIGLKLIATYPF